MYIRLTLKKGLMTNFKLGFNAKTMYILFNCDEFATIVPKLLSNIKINVLKSF